MESDLTCPKPLAQLMTSAVARSENNLPSRTCSLCLHEASSETDPTSVAPPRSPADRHITTDQSDFSCAAHIWLFVAWETFQKRVLWSSFFLSVECLLNVYLCRVLLAGETSHYAKGLMGKCRMSIKGMREDLLCERLQPKIVRTCVIRLWLEKRTR